ncbi:MAG: apolipoprotein N-acyltransferase [Cycloclasticus sp.]|nr:MAG: apolipoprotein N-acyltransferase [Cycloclasticus sp.]
MLSEQLTRHKSNIFGLLSGALLPFAFAPYDYPIIAVLSLLLFLLILRQLAPMKAAVAGYAFGLGYFGHGVYWVYFSIHHFGHAPLWLAVIIMLGMVAILALYMGLLAYLLNRFFLDDSVTRYLLAFPSLWLGLEALRGVLFTGFPWLSLGYSQIDTWLSGWAPIVGVLGVSWVTALTAGSLASALNCSKFSAKISVVIFAVLFWLAGWGLTTVSWVEPAGKTINVALLQGNVPQEIKWLRSFQRINNNIYKKMTKQQSDVDLIVWPETSIPAFYHGVKDSLIAELRQQAVERKADIIVGLPVMRDGTHGYFNGLHSVQYPDSFYLKRHLVPLGEYMPLKPLSTFILDFLKIPLSDFSAGGDNQPLLKGAGYPFASSICYEDVFQQSSIDGLPEAAYLINVSNDTWFGDTIAPYQHLQMARMRALESGRYLLRATNTGLTAIVDSLGQIIKQAPMFKRFSLKGYIIPLKGETPFVKGGWWCIFVFAAVMVLVSFMMRNKRVK